MRDRLLIPWLAAALVVPLAASSRPPVPVPTATVVPTMFGVGGNGAPSPAGCHIVTPVQQPHISSYERRSGRTAVKGKAFAVCNQPVDELSLSVSLFDVGAHREVYEGPAHGNKGQKALSVQDAILPCANTDTTTYQVGVLGTSYEKGQEYTQILLSAPQTVACGHA